MRRYLSLLPASLSLALPAIASAQVESVPSAVDAVRATYESYEAALDRGDAAAVAAFWTEDGTYMGMGTPTTRGRIEIERLARELLSTTKLSSRTTKIDEVTTAGDFAYLMGTTSVLVERGGQTPLRVSARLLFVWQRAPDGRWRIARVMSNDEPSRQ